MSDRTTTPNLGANSFTCPHCFANSHQTWFRVFLDSYEKDDRPWMPDAESIERIKQNDEVAEKSQLIDYIKRKLAKELFPDQHAQPNYLNTELVNLSISRCYSCDKSAVWLADRLIYPAQPTSIQPNVEMPSNVRADFLEATSIVDQSPRGAAALLRLCLQKLMGYLGQKGKNIDDDIGALVKVGLDARVQKALDVVRVVGNNAVHPGQIDLRDDKATAIQLFNLVNLIVEAMIETPKHIDAMYGALPKAAREAIEKRDS